MLDGRNNRLFSLGEQMFFLMQVIFIVLPSSMAAVQNLSLYYFHIQIDVYHNGKNHDYFIIELF